MHRRRKSASVHCNCAVSLDHERLVAPSSALLRACQRMRLGRSARTCAGHVVLRRAALRAGLLQLLRLGARVGHVGASVRLATGASAQIVIRAPSSAHLLDGRANAKDREEEGARAHLHSNARAACPASAYHGNPGRSAGSTTSQRNDSESASSCVRTLHWCGNGDGLRESAAVPCQPCSGRQRFRAFARPTSQRNGT